MKTVFTFSFLFIVFNAFNQPGSLDSTFNDSGKVINNNFGIVNSAALQSDSKILVGGNSVNDTSHNFAIARYTSDGDLDASFGSNGKIETIFNGGSSIYNLNVLSSGKILAAGYGLDFVVFPFYQSPLLAQYLSNGHLDSSFGMNGKVSLDMTAVKGVSTKAMQVMSDGRIVQASENGLQGTTIIRYKSNGSLDSTFGTNGISSIPLYGLDQINALTIQTDNKIIVGGEAGIGSGGNFLIARFQSNGKLDSSFGNNGKRIIDFNENEDAFYALAVQPDGKILAAGKADSNGISTPIMTLLRFKSDGFLDSTFGQNGMAFGNFGDRFSGATSLVLQPDGKIDVGGFAYTPTTSDSATGDFALAQFNADGSLNSGFSDTGSVITSFGYFQDIASLALQTDNKILAAGTADANTGDPSEYNLALARYKNTNGTLLIALKDFSAAPAGSGTIKLSWQAVSAVNNNYFSIERSSDSHFNGNEIAKIYSNGEQSYAYTDNTPLQGANYYRLKQVDKDGSFSYSNVVAVTLQNETSITTYPNPAKNILHIKGLDANMKYESRIMNEKGNVVLTTTINKNSVYDFNVQNLSKGIYYLNLISSNKTLPTGRHETITVKFVKE
ncbi:MAG TPA: T9SS type A sorting domain-containing protein [Parafilimonas sp.]|nr:T9SS type A sorting domain-containing protein [Parafilimonas sp.]